jgi:hypothetical protein
VAWFAGLVVGALAGVLVGWLTTPSGRGRLRQLAGARRSWGNGLAAIRQATSPADGRGEPGGALPADERLTRLARERLTAQELASLRVDVTTVDGAVYLRGRTRTPAEVEAIASIVQAIPGVQRVVNELKPPGETA